MKKTIILLTFACITAFNSTHTAIHKLDFKDKFEFLHEEENQLFYNAIQQIKWRIRSGYLAELNYDLNAVRWLVKKLAQNFNITTTYIAARVSTPATRQYIQNTRQYIKIVKTYGEKEALKYQYHLYPEYYNDLYRSDTE